MYICRIAFMIRQPKRSNNPGGGLLRLPRTRRAGFTLVELLAVVLVIVLLAGLMISVTGYVQKTVAISTTKIQLAAIAAGLEAYKADWGFYPITTPARISNRGNCEATNNFILFNALYPPINTHRKTYVRFPSAQIRTNLTTGLPNICDPWGTPFNYYCSPSTAYGVSNNYPNPVTGTNTGYTVGGQVNGGTYDLFSYGPNKLTYVPGAAYPQGNYSGWYQPAWTNTTAANDDIGNFQK